MSLAIFWTKEAQETFDLTFNFIKSKWGEKEAVKFLKRTQKIISNISQQPYIFKSSAIEINVRKGFISKQTCLFYEVKEARIILLYFWDNRQEPII